MCGCGCGCRLGRSSLVMMSVTLVGVGDRWKDDAGLDGFTRRWMDVVGVMAMGRFQ
jgi:hypothetical protein